jgi:hypothetical protein
MNRLILSLAILTACASSKKVQCDSYSQEKKINGTTTIIWQEDQVDHIGILNNDQVVVPTIPTNDANQLHINGLTSGTYTIVFYSNTEILFKKKIEIIY